MRQTALALLACLLLTAGSAWAAGSVAVPPNGAIDVVGDDCDLSVTSADRDRVSVACSAAHERINGVPVCRVHDPNRWHALVERDPDGSVLCTYGHHHGDDPNLVADVLGPPGAAWGRPGEAYGYPWLTSPLEQSQKHELFKTIVRRDLPSFGGPSYVKHFRATTHLLGSGGHIPGRTAKDGFQSQVHSWQLEAVICTTADDRCGIIRTGGHQDIGAGFLAQPGGPPIDERCALPNGFDAACDQAITRHIHGEPGSPRLDFTWYAATSPPYRRLPGADRVSIDFGTIGQAWAYVDPNDYDALPFIDPDRFTASWLSQEILGINLDAGMAGWDRSTNRVTLVAWTDNWGNVVRSGCAMPSVACVPLEISDVPAGQALYRDSFLQARTGREPWVQHDVRVTVDGQRRSLTKYPN